MRSLTKTMSLMLLIFLATCLGSGRGEPPRFDQIVFLDTPTSFGCMDLWLAKDGKSSITFVEGRGRNQTEVLQTRYDYLVAPEDFESICALLSKRISSLTTAKSHNAAHEESSGAIYCRAGSCVVIIAGWEQEDNTRSLRQVLLRVAESARMGRQIVAREHDSYWEPSGFPDRETIRSLAFPKLHRGKIQRNREQHGMRKRSFQENINALGDKSSDSQVEGAINDIVGAGTAAFDDLLRNLQNQALADPKHFQKQEVLRRPDGGWGPYPPRIGDACFGIFQRQLEADLPKGFQQYWQLTPQNASEWWQRNRNRDLWGLRLELARESLLRAQESHDTKAVQYLMRVVQDIEAEGTARSH